jgi:hypothetical protein
MRFLRILSWAVFLGASWTWCIGMYLPALLLRDYGIWALIVFAVPNVIGAAAMAWVLPDADASRAFVAKHKTACEWFSVVTLLFHVFFIVWIPRVLLGGQEGHGIYPLLATVFMLAGLLARWQWGAILISAAATSYSVAVAHYLSHLRLPVIPLLPDPVAPSLDILWLALVCTFGLMLCPYLDLTFHRARQATTATEGKAAFAIGFGVVFAAALLFTVAYSRWLLIPFDYWQTSIIFPLGSYFLVQATLKLSLHSWAAISRPQTLVIVSVCALLLSSEFGSESPYFWFSYRGLDYFEVIYRCFLVFYALIFPAYVWICIFHKKSPRLWLTAIAIAAPMYWMGFIERQMIWLLPGVAIVFLAPLTALVSNQKIPKAHG